MKLLARFHAWRAERRHLAHQRWLRKQRVVFFGRPEPKCVVRNLREPNR